MQLKLPKSKEKLRREAAAWLARLQSAREPDAERKFRDWYEADPAHSAAFDRIRQSYDSAALLRQSSAFGDRILEPRSQSRPPAARYALAAAAALVLAVPAIVAVGDRGLLPLGSTNRLMIATALGEIRSARLSDGSKVTLDTRTELEVELGRSARRARVRSGRVRFDIAMAAQPFVIEAGRVKVTTAQAVLDVEQLDGKTRVDMVSGEAKIEGAGADGSAGVMLGGGRSMTSVPGGTVDLRAVPLRSEWTRGMLQFDSAPFAEAVELANRYSARRIVLGPGLEGLRVSGAFRAGDTAGLARALASVFDLSLRSGADGTLFLSRRARGANRASLMPLPSCLSC